MNGSKLTVLRFDNAGFSGDGSDVEAIVDRLARSDRRDLDRLLDRLAGTGTGRAAFDPDRELFQRLRASLLSRLLRRSERPEGWTPPEGAGWAPPRRPGDRADLRRLVEALWDAAADGAPRRMDRLLDRMREDCLDGGRRSRHLARIDRGLDQLGSDALDLGPAFDRDSVLIQRLRAAVRAGITPSGVDALRTDSRELAARLEEAGRSESARIVRAALGALDARRRHLELIV